MHLPEVLIISSQFDFSTDLIANRLKLLGVKYLRLNIDQLSEYAISLDPIIPKMFIEFNNQTYCISSQKLTSIYYRAPTFLRDIYQINTSEEEQLYRTQWIAFIRSLILFDNVKWVNNPVETYKAEIKPYQLYLASKIGFQVPHTIVSNKIYKNNYKKIAVKSIDTAIVSNSVEEKFIYTEFFNMKDIKSSIYSSPFFIQKALIPKVDLRITVIGNKVIPVKIFSSVNINEDWRKFKGEINYELTKLPNKIKVNCLKMMKSLNLNFCAIDLIIYRSKYYFIELNPTGEWAWLQKNTNFEFDLLISKQLIHA